MFHRSIFAIAFVLSFGALYIGCDGAFSALAEPQGDTDQDSDSSGSYFLSCEPQYGYQGTVLDVQVRIIGLPAELENRIVNDPETSFYVTEISFGEGIYYSKFTVVRTPPGFEARLRISPNAQIGQRTVHAEFTAGSVHFSGTGAFFVIGQRGGDWDEPEPTQ